VLAVGEHRESVTGCEAAWLGTEVKEDGIGFPTAKSTNSHFVDAGDKEGGGTPGAEAVGFDAVGGMLVRWKMGVAAWRNSNVMSCMVTS
jgi:hypothetical protein